MKVNYRHQLCATNFATLQLWRRRSLSGNCTLSLVEGGRQSRKFERCGGSAGEKLQIEFLKDGRFFRWKLSQARALDSQLRDWKLEKVKVEEKWKWRKVKVKKSESEKSNFLWRELSLLLHFRIRQYQFTSLMHKNTKSKSTMSSVVFKYLKKNWIRSILCWQEVR